MSCWGWQLGLTENKSQAQEEIINTSARSFIQSRRSPKLVFRVRSHGEQIDPWVLSSHYGQHLHWTCCRDRWQLWALLIFGNTIRKWSATARISVSISPGRLSRVIVFIFLPLGERVHLTNQICCYYPFRHKECLSMWVINREDCNRSLLLTLVRMIYCSNGEANRI